MPLSPFSGFLINFSGTETHQNFSAELMSIELASGKLSGGGRMNGARRRGSARKKAAGLRHRKAKRVPN